MTDQHDDLTYGHASHRAFNERFEPKSPARDLTGPWIPYDAHPHLRQEFDMNRDPYIRKALLAMEQTESQRREEQDGRSSVMVSKDKPAAHLKPSTSMRKQADRHAFQGRWLVEQRDAVLAQAKQARSSNECEKERGYSRDYTR